MRQRQPNLILLGFITFAFSLSLELVESAMQVTPQVAAAEVEDKTLALAKQEGKLVVFVPPGRQVREALMVFQKKFGIELEITGATGRVLVPRMTAERQSQRYLWDIYIGGPGTLNHSLKPAGFLDSVKTYLLPEVLDDKRWIGGFDAGFKDKEKQFAYGFQGDVSDHTYVNRDVAPESALKGLEDLASAQWKGKIAWRDPRIDGSGASYAGYLLAVNGEKYLRQLLANTGVVSEDRRQIAEWLVRNRYPIAVGINITELAPFWKEGLAGNVKSLSWVSAEIPLRITAGSAVIGAINRAPHPNAARIFLNWLLSKEGQEVWTKSTNLNSRRLDVWKIEESAAQEGRRYIDINEEQNLPFQDKAIKIAREIIK